MHPPELRRHFVDFVHVRTLMALMFTTKSWNAAADALIDEGVQSGELMVHNGTDISCDVVEAQEERHKLVTRVIFLLNITKVGKNACRFAINLIVVDIPEGVESIGEHAFYDCRSLTSIYFPTTLTLIGEGAFRHCYSLDNVDLLHTNLQELGRWAFGRCSELKKMTIPDSLQKLGEDFFRACSKLVPRHIDINNEINYDDVTSEVIAHLRSQQLLSATPPAPPTSDFLNTTDFSRLLVGFVQADTLMALRSTTKAWKVVAEEVIDERVASGAKMIHVGRDLSYDDGFILSFRTNARMERMKRVTQVIFLLNIKIVGDCTCKWAVNLIVVEILEGVQRIGQVAFMDCSSLTTVFFPTTLTYIGPSSIHDCFSLDNVDLLHTNLQEIDDQAFGVYPNLNSMTIPDSLQTLGKSVFSHCNNLVPSNISPFDNNNVVTHLRKLQASTGQEEEAGCILS